MKLEKAINSLIQGEQPHSFNILLYTKLNIKKNFQNLLSHLYKHNIHWTKPDPRQFQTQARYP